MGFDSAKDIHNGELLLLSEISGSISPEDEAKLKALSGVPTQEDDIYTMIGNEGKGMFDVVSMFLGGEMKDDLSVIGRTNLTSQETTTIARGLILAKQGMEGFLGYPPNEQSQEWAIPIIKDYIKWILRGRPSIDGKSIETAKEALQAIKIKLDTQPKPLNQV